MTYYKSVSIKDEKFHEKLIDNFFEEGIAVITDVFSDDDCDHYVGNMIEYFEKLGTGIKKNKIKETWIDYNLPPQTRPGLFQTLVSNMPVVWTIRSDKNVRKIFETIYSKSREKEVTEFICSNDGINLRPNGIDDYRVEKKDWPHLDQTIRNDPFRCVQGQAVLTNTTACLRASPKSYKVFEKIMDYHGITDTDLSNWVKFKDNDMETLKKIVEDAGAQWQIPILAPKGSFIIWSSSTIHSARLAIKKSTQH